MRIRRGAVALTTVLATMGMVVPAQAATTYTARLSGADEVPANSSPARGTAIFQLSADGTELHYRLIAANIENVVAAHIHLGGPGVNGPVVAFLIGPLSSGQGRTNGVLRTGTITADDLVPSSQVTTMAALVDELNLGTAYVNVHTNDGVPPTNTGPGDLPGGEIRGQIR